MRAQAPYRARPMAGLIAGKYEILETIGKGGMGTVYRARQASLDRIVALKMLSEDLASDPDFRARFQQEAALLAKLSHPNIVQVIDIEPHKHTFCIIMEFVSGETLQAKVNRLGSLPEAEALRLVAQVSRGLAYAHRQGIVHRDVKPDNILLGEDGRPRMTDFGIAYFAGSKLKTQTGISMGTPRYMAPEQVTGKGLDGQADLYSLGICTYFALTGTVPFDGDNAIEIATKQVYENPKPPSAVHPAVSPEADLVVMKALAKLREERFADGDAMAEALESAASSPGDSDGYKRETPMRSGPMVLGASGMPVYGGETQHSIPANPRTPASGQFTAMATQTPQGAAALALATPPAGTMPSITPSAPVDLVPIAPMPDFGEEFLSPDALRSATPTPRASTIVRDVTPTPTGRAGSGVSSGEPTPSAGRRNSAARRWWPATAALTLIVAAAIYATYERQPLVENAGTDPKAKQSLTAREAEQATLESETAALLASKRPKEAARRWEEFRKKYEVGDTPAPVIANADEWLRWLKSQYPLADADALVQRRLEICDELQKQALFEVARAYAESAKQIFGQSKEQVANVERRLRLFATPAPPAESAEGLLKSALKLQEQTGQRTPRPLLTATDRAIERAFIRAANADPRGFDAWLAAGDFYAAAGALDDARVFYSHADQIATTGEQRGTLRTKQEKLETP